MDSVIIIGSGLGGLISGAILSKSGYRVTILEKHRVAGGCLQDFRRDGVTFNTGMHYIGSFDKGQTLYKIFNYLEIANKISAKRLDSEAFDIINIGGESFCYAMGRENFTKLLIDRFPEDKISIEQYVDKIYTITDSVDLFNLRKTESTLFSIYPEQEISAYNYICSITDNNLLIEVLSGLNSLYAGTMSESSLFMHAIINRFYIDSAWRIERGGDIADGLIEVICNNSGEIKLSSEVVKINCSSREVTSVELIDGQQLSADHYISNIHPVSTIDITEGKAFKKGYVSRVKGLKNTISSFTLYIKVKEGTLKHLNSNFYYNRGDSVWGVDNYDSAAWPQGFMLYSSESGNNPGYAESITVVTPMKYREVEEWSSTTVGRRGDDYLEFKRVKSELLIDIIGSAFDQVDGDRLDPDIYIDSYYSATPLTYRDYTGTVEGSMYGVIRSSVDPIQTTLLPDTHLKNLLFTGQNINLHGVLGVTLGAILTTGRLIDVNSIIDKINEKID